MKAQVLTTFLASLWLAATSAHCAIVYSPGPASQSPPLRYPPSQDVDLDGDGLADFSLWSYGVICTDDYPSSFCSWPYYVGAVGTNQILLSGYHLILQSFGADIGSHAPPGTAWATPQFGAWLAASWWSLYGNEIDGQLVYSGWRGPLGDLGVAYMAVRFYAADGSHYGWIRVRLPSPSGFLFDAPVVVDWAYETCPDRPIRAGDIGSAGESVQFTVEWSSPRHGSGRATPEVGTGSFILTGNRLRGELSLAGQFSSAHIVGPGNPRQRAEPLSDFGQPLVANASRSAFFSEVILTSSQVKHLLRGQYCVTVDDGVLTGQILLLASAHRGPRLIRPIPPAEPRNGRASKDTRMPVCSKRTGPSDGSPGIRHGKAWSQFAESR